MILEVNGLLAKLGKTASPDEAAHGRKRTDQRRAGGAQNARRATNSPCAVVCGVASPAGGGKAEEGKGMTWRQQAAANIAKPTRALPWIRLDRSISSAMTLRRCAAFQDRRVAIAAAPAATKDPPAAS